MDIRIHLVQTVLTQNPSIRIIPTTMSKDDGRIPQFPRGSKEWVQSLNPRSTTHGTMITSEIRNATQAVLGDCFSEAAWRGMFAGGSGSSSQDRGNSRTSPSMISLMQGLGWSTNHPEFQYVVAQMHIRLGKLVRVPAGSQPVEVYRKAEVEGREVRVFVRRDEPPQPADVQGMREHAAEFAAAHDISTERQAELRSIAEYPFLSYARRQKVRVKLEKGDTAGFIEALSA